MKKISIFLSVVLFILSSLFLPLPAYAFICGHLGNLACEVPPSAYFCDTGTKISQKNHFCVTLSYDDTHNFEAKNMESKFLGENTKCVWQEKSSCPPFVEYLEKNDLDNQQVNAWNGLLYRGDVKLDTQSADKGHEGEPRAIYVMDTNGNIYVSNSHQLYRFHHSSFLRGAPVAAAGELNVKNGQVISYSNCSGHYRPPKSLLPQFKAQLIGMGIDLSKATEISCNLNMLRY